VSRRPEPQNLEELRDVLGVSVECAARFLGISRGAAYGAVHRGELPAFEIAGRFIVKAPELLAMCGAQVGENTLVATLETAARHDLQ